MDDEERKRRLENPLQYKFNALHEFYSDSEIKHKGGSDLIRCHKNRLKELDKMKADLNKWFEFIFDDEPTDEDLKRCE